MLEFRRSLIWIPAILAIAACDSSLEPLESSPDLAAVVFHDNTTFDIVASRFNPCTNENFTVSGKIHVVFHVTQTPSGGLIINGSANFQNLTGTGDTGMYTYHITGKSVAGFNGPLIFTPGGALVDVTVRPQRWVATRGGDNQMFDAVFLFVFNANGDLVNVKLDSSVRCVG